MDLEKQVKEELGKRKVVEREKDLDKRDKDLDKRDKELDKSTLMLSAAWEQKDLDHSAWVKKYGALHKEYMDDFATYKATLNEYKEENKELQAQVNAYEKQAKAKKRKRQY